MARSPITASKEGEATLAAEETLHFDDDNLRAIAEVYKNEGNDEYKQNNFNNAVQFYTEGIEVNCKDEELNAILYSNRAAARFNLGNYTKTLDDAKIAVGLRPSFLKAFVRGASACVQLKKFDEAITWCDKGLAIDPNNHKLLGIRSWSMKENSKLQGSHQEKETCTKATNTAAENISNFGNAHHSLEDFKTAIDYHERHLRIAKELGDRTKEGRAYDDLGIAHHIRGDFKAAKDYHERHLKIANELGDRLAEGRAFGNLGNAHYRMGDFKTALHFHERHLKIAKELDDRSGEGKAYGNLGNVYQSLGDLKTAIKYHELHLNIAEELGDRSGEGRAYGNLGNAYHSLGDFKRAVDYHERDLKIAKELGDRSGEGQAYCNLGNAYRHLGDFKTALSYHENDLKIVEELGDRSGKGRAYSNLGNAYLRLGDFETALDYHERSLEIAKEFGDRPGEGIAYGNLGNAHESLGNIKTAIDCYERLLNTSKKLGDRSGEGKAYSNLGNTQQRLGDFKSAIAYHEHHLKIAKELNDRSGEGAAYCNLGNAYDSLGDFKTAIDYYERHLKIEERLGDRSGEGKAYGNLGNVYYSLGNFKTASDYHKRDLNIAQALGDRLGEERAYGNLGNTHHSLGDYVTAIEYHARALNIAKELGDTPGEGVAHGNLGNAYQSLGDFSTAIDYHKSVLKIAKALGDKSLEEKAYCNLGNAHYSLEDFKTAIDYHKRSMKTAKELGDTLGEGVTCSNLGKCFEILGQVPVAIEYYQLGITLFNNIRDRLELNDEWKISLRDNYPIVYTSLWRLLLAEGKVTEALFSAEQGRAQGLKDLLELNYAFKRSDVERSDARSGTGNKSVNDLLSYPFPNTFFMAFGENELNIWVCQRGKDVELKTKQIDSPDEVNIFFMDLLQVLHQEIGTRSLLKCEDRSLELARDESLVAKRSPQYGRETQDLGLTKDALSTLYEIMIEPIQDLFLGSELIFIPEGQLCLAPFAAFKGPDSKYVCESFKIRVAPSLTSLKMIEDCQVDYHHKSGALLVGDPLTERPPLPCAREEVEMIGRMLGITPVLGTQATKDEVLTRLGSVALVHIAAHGNMETGEIALASTEGVKENILTMRDVLGVQMRARLVVLSCCHSARGEIKAEGVVGIARAFLGAGARSVLVSLWAIDDEATLEFMKNFYQHLVKGISASESLNQTMNCMRESEKFNEVKYWAPFVLIGDDVTLEFAGNE